MTSSKDKTQNTQETFDWVWGTVRTSLGYLCFIFNQIWTRLLDERIVLSSDTIQSLVTIRMATMYFFDFEVRIAS